ncbi:MAG: SGNH/GDSL hydrolase family protein [Planctomycetaceae bacterium]|jgi:lysophospholipase L1-like esterase|nr:SGNH/GDSL hydrolase family protein [Planctomycetaceae bacterium]
MFQYLTTIFSVIFLVNMCFGEEPAVMRLTGDWTVEVQFRGQTATLNIDPSDQFDVKAEKYDRLPLYNEQRTWNNELVLTQTKGTDDFPTSFALVSGSVIVRDGSGANAKIFESEKDYNVFTRWGAVGRTPESRIGEHQPVWIDYRYGKMRIDSVVLTKDGKIELRKGTPHIMMPQPPSIVDGERRLGNIWIKANTERLDANALFPILETEFHEPPKTQGNTVAEKLLPKTMAKINSGEKLRILAWGDSVTDAGYLKDPKTERWQEQFVKRLQKRFPNAKIELLTEAWGGRGSGSYLAEPAGSKYNFKEKILDLKPDLIIMEFVNDAGLSGEALIKQYSILLESFRKIGAEWIILAPHYVRTDWMGLDRERNIDDDPRQYVKDLRRFAAENRIALADAAARYGRLWRQGIPYSTLMSNNINHPDKTGLKIFADALMELFP